MEFYIHILKNEILYRKLQSKTAVKYWNWVSEPFFSLFLNLYILKLSIINFSCDNKLKTSLFKHP